jgi:cell division protein FtsB
LRKKINNQTEVINALLAMRAKRNAEAIKRLKEELKKSKEEIAKVKQERDNIINDNKKMKDLYF